MARAVPVSKELPRYRLHTARGDAIATATVAAPAPRRCGNSSKHLRRDGITLVTARAKSHIQQRFDETGLTEAIGSDHAYPTVHAAVDACDGERLQPA